MTGEPWGAVAGALLMLGLGIVVGASIDDAGRPREPVPEACPAVPVQVTTTTGTLPPQVQP